MPGADKITQTPWSIKRHRPDPGSWDTVPWLALMGADGSEIAVFTGSPKLPKDVLERGEADIALCRAAPDMRDALRYCYDHIRDAAQNGVDISAFYGEMEWRIRAALEKGEGEE